MLNIPLLKLLNSSKNILFIVLIMLVFVFSILHWIQGSRYHDFLDNQTKLSEQSLRGVANEINQYIHHSRQLADILVAERKDDIQSLYNNPDDPLAFFKLNESIKQFFPEAFNYTIANSSGVPLLKDPQKFIGKGCRTDIKNFSKGIHLNEIFVHSNPKVENYHFDVLAEIKDMGSNNRGIFFVSLDTRNLQRLIKNGEPAYHQFFILRKDKQALIEMTSNGTRAILDRHKSLQSDEINNIIASVDIEGTRWKLIDILQPEIKVLVQNEFKSDAMVIAAVFILFSIIFIVIILIHEKNLLSAEIEIKALNETLENRVEQRTKDLKASKKELTFQARHDHLTGLYNRREFEFQLEQLIKKAKEEAIESVIFYMDLDQFKVVNDTAGHSSGDELLRQIALLLKSELRTSDILARLGGDEFGILLENCPLKKATLIADALHQSINNFTFTWTDRTYHLGISIGIVSIDAHTKDIAETMSIVDASCYTAKSKGRNSIHVYTPDDSQLQSHRGQMFWASEAIQAIESGRMLLFCQLIESIGTSNNILWYEILVRIKDRKDKIIYPDMFIPALESYGGIEQLDLAVIKETIKFMAQHDNIKFNINISGVSISNQKFHQKVVDLLKNESNINPEHIVFEITETAMVSNLTIAKEFISTMKALKCSIALDDFGSGMSSFAYLKNLDVDYIKLDGVFVKNIDDDEIHYSMVSAINSVAQSMGKPTIAEFVEHQAVSTSLKEIGINYGQGYHYHRPAPLTNNEVNNHQK